MNREIEECFRKECLSDWNEWVEGECEFSGKQCGCGKKTTKRECPGPYRCPGDRIQIKNCFKACPGTKIDSQLWEDFSNCFRRKQ